MGKKPVVGLITLVAVGLSLTSSIGCSGGRPLKRFGGDNYKYKDKPEPSPGDKGWRDQPVPQEGVGTGPARQPTKTRIAPDPIGKSGNPLLDSNIAGGKPNTEIPLENLPPLPSEEIESPIASVSGDRPLPGGNPILPPEEKAAPLPGIPDDGLPPGPATTRKVPVDGGTSSGLTPFREPAPVPQLPPPPLPASYRKPFGAKEQPIATNPKTRPIHSVPSGDPISTGPLPKLPSSPSKPALPEPNLPPLGRSAATPGDVLPPPSPPLPRTSEKPRSADPGSLPQLGSPAPPLPKLPVPDGEPLPTLPK